jgi:hypothetical protein
MLSRQFWEKSFSDPAIFWSMIAALGTIALLCVAYKQLSDLARTSKADFLHRLKKDFFTEEARRLVFLFDHDLIDFRGTTPVPFFELRKNSDHEDKDRLKELGIGFHTVSCYTVDDLLLGPLEDIGILEDSKLVDIEHVYQVFDHYVSMLAESRAIRDYIGWVRRENNDPEIYDHFLGLYGRLREHKKH